MIEPLISFILVAAPAVLFLVYLIGYTRGRDDGYDQACADYSIAKVLHK